MRKREARNAKGNDGDAPTLCQKLATSTTTLQIAKTIPIIAEARRTNHKQHPRDHQVVRG